MYRIAMLLLKILHVVCRMLLTIPCGAIAVSLFLDVREESQNRKVVKTRNSENANEHIPLLADCNEANWHLIAVGGAHVVLRYEGNVPELQSRVLKLRKQQPNTNSALQLGFAKVLGKLRSGGAIGCRSGGGSRTCKEQTTSKLYSVIPAKYLPLQQIIRVPQTVADRLLLRTVAESTHSDASSGRDHSVQPRQDKSVRGSLTSSGMPWSNAGTDPRQPPAGISPLGNDSGPKYHREGGSSGETQPYVLCLLEENLVTAPLTFGNAHVASNAAGARKNAQTLRTSPKISATHASRQGRNSPPPVTYYAIEFKPKCGLLERLDGQQLTLLAGLLRNRPAQKRFVLQRPLRNQRCPIDDAEVTETAAADAGVEQVNSSMKHCLGNRFRMQQYLKLKTGRISRPSLYDPVQFFRCITSSRIVRGHLLDLLDDPQNNLKVFCSGVAVANFGSAPPAKSKAELSSSTDTAERCTTGTQADSFVILLLERIWERDRELFEGILLMQAFAAGQQRLSAQLVVELRRLLGVTYERLREEQFLRDVNFYLEAASAGTALLRSSTTRFESRGNVFPQRDSSNCVPRVSLPSRGRASTWARSRPELSPYGRGRARGSPSIPKTQRSLNFVDAMRVQYEHEREGLDILNILKTIDAKKNQNDFEGTGLPDIVEVAFRWLRQYLLGRTFMDVSIFTNILIADSDTPLGIGSEGINDDDTWTSSRFEQLELDEELAASAALLVGDLLKSTTSARAEATSSRRRTKISSRLPTIFFRVTITDMDFKSDRNIGKWSKMWTDIQRAYSQMRPATT